MKRLTLLALLLTPVLGLAQGAVDRAESLLKKGNLQGALEAARGPAQAGNARAIHRRIGACRQQPLCRSAAAANEPTAIALVRAAGNRDAPALIDAAAWLGNFDRSRDAIALLNQQADAGDAPTRVVLGTIYYNGQGGGGRDFVRARQGHPDGRRMAASMRDLKLPPGYVEAGPAENEIRCSVSGGTAIGTSCWKDSKPLW
jgi:TPR repeat protein